MARTDHLTIRIDGDEAAARFRGELQPSLQAAADLAETVAGALSRADHIAEAGHLPEPLHGHEGKALLERSDEANLQAALDHWTSTSAELLGTYADEAKDGAR